MDDPKPNAHQEALARQRAQLIVSFRQACTKWHELSKRGRAEGEETYTPWHSALEQTRTRLEKLFS